jgi:hypothetical protein
MSATALLLGALVVQAREATPGVTIETGDLPAPLTYVVAMARGGDGSLFLLDPPQKSLFRFSPRGEFLGRVGRDGEGPGEFRWPLGLGTLGEDIWVVDMQLRRLTVFDRALKPAITRTLKESGISAPVAGGGHVVQPSPLDVRPGADRTKEEVTLQLVQPDGERFLIGKWIVDETPITLNSPGFVSQASQPFADRALWAVSPDGGSVVFVEHGTGGGSPALVAVTASGAPRFRTSLQVPRIRLTDAMYQRAIDSLVDYLKQAKPSARASNSVDAAWVRQAVNRPADVGPVTRLLAGADGRIWLQLRGSPRPGYAEWKSFSARGAAGSSVLLPVDTRMLLFTSTSAWGARENADGEPVVVEYLLPR